MERFLKRCFAVLIGLVLVFAPSAVAFAWSPFQAGPTYWCGSYWSYSPCSYTRYYNYPSYTPTYYYPVYYYYTLPTFYYYSYPTWPNYW